ncbi:MAG: hypothetical protein RLN90_01475 [Balneolaceae bacterium]
MNNNERLAMLLILVSITVLTSIDIFTDYFDGVAWWHIVIESIIALFALSGVYYLLIGRIKLKHSLETEQQSNLEFEQEAQKWKKVSKSYIDGLSKEIDKQLTVWELTKAEKDVAFLLLKGLSLKEIASVRYTSVKTTRTQTNAIYSKSGLSGRSELSAFFLEDLLLPAN